MSNGLVTQIIGAVIDVEFEKNNIPQVYEAIKITDTGTVLEVQQQLGDGIVRAIEVIKQIMEGWEEIPSLDK